MVVVAVMVGKKCLWWGFSDGVFTVVEMGG